MMVSDADAVMDCALSPKLSTAIIRISLHFANDHFSRYKNKLHHEMGNFLSRIDQRAFTGNMLQYFKGMRIIRYLLIFKLAYLISFF
jgi:hypothetical protein